MHARQHASDRHLFFPVTAPPGHLRHPQDRRFPNRQRCLLCALYGCLFYCPMHRWGFGMEWLIATSYAACCHSPPGSWKELPDALSPCHTPQTCLLPSPIRDKKRSPRPLMTTWRWSAGNVQRTPSYTCSLASRPRSASS